MKTIKLFDAWIQVLLIISCTLLAISKSGDYFFAAYFIVGTWQVISTLIHAIAKWHIPHKKFREYYNWLLLLLVIVCLLAMLIPSILYLLFIILVFFTPVMAIFYTAICFEELNELNKRPLAQLK